MITDDLRSAYIDQPLTPRPHVVHVYRQHDGKLFYGATYPEGLRMGPPSRTACYRVRIRMRAKP